MLLSCLFLYAAFDGGWILFVVLFFVPDLSMLGYVINAKVGAIIYNIAHSYILPVVFLVVGYYMADRQMLLLSLIWSAHISLDRTLGLGLKELTGFRLFSSNS